MPELAALAVALEAGLDPGLRAWWRAAQPGDAGAAAGTVLRAAIASCARRFKGAPGIALGTGVPALDTAGRAQQARAILIARGVGVLGDAAPRWVRELFHRSGDAEQQAVLIALPLLAGADRFVDLAIEACRTNVADVFAAIALDNPYPAAHFPDAAFNQMVLKAVFIGLPLARVSGLGARRNPEMARMARDFGAERRAAARPVPADLNLIDGTPA